MNTLHNSQRQRQPVLRRVGSKLWSLCCYCILGCAICLCSPCLCAFVVSLDRNARRKRLRRGRGRHYIDESWPDPDQLKSPFPRQRALSLTFDETPQRPTGDFLDISKNQQCLFFQMLPREIRDCIYYELLGGETLLIRRYPGSGGIRAKWGKYDQDQHVDEDQIAVTLGQRLSVLQTCRTIYSEAISILYSRNTYQLEDGLKPSFRILSDLQYVFLPQRFSAIRDLDITFDLRKPKNQFYYAWQWNRLNDDIFPDSHNIWEMLSTMKNLRRLRLHFYCELVYNKTDAQTPFKTFFATEEALLRPVMELDWIPDFRVRVSWPANEDSKIVLKNAPFRLERVLDDWSDVEA